MNRKTILTWQTWLGKMRACGDAGAAVVGGVMVRVRRVRAS